jgi:hypothetical protein
MMRRLVRVIAVVAGLELLLSSTAVADMLYPIAPAGSFVALHPGDFIQFVPEQSPGLPDPNPVTGDILGQHPGAFVSGMPPAGTFFVGLFGGAVDTNDPQAALYLWETSGGLGDAFQGPQIQLGYWNGTAFIPYGNPQAAFYLDTGVLSDLGPPWMPAYGGREIYSSRTPLSALGIYAGLPLQLNAVRIEATESAHDQVTAVAANTVPEPSSMLLLCTCIAGGLLTRRCVRGRRPS